MEANGDKTDTMKSDSGIIRYLILSVLTLFLILSSGCANQSSSPNAQTTDDRIVMDAGEKILLGPMTYTDLQQPLFKSWFDDSYNSYKANGKTVEAMADKMDGITFKVFMGTWCSDSQYYVPGFFKILHYLKYDPSSVEMVAVNNDKNEPESELKGYDIEWVPTIIVYRHGKALGRIVESPDRSLEEDLLKLIGQG